MARMSADLWHEGGGGEGEHGVQGGHPLQRGAVRGAADRVAAAGASSYNHTIIHPPSDHSQVGEGLVDVVSGEEHPLLWQPHHQLVLGRSHESLAYRHFRQGEGASKH